MLTTCPMSIPRSLLYEFQGKSPIPSKHWSRPGSDRTSFEVLHKRHSLLVPKDAYVDGPVALAEYVVAMAPVCMCVVIHHPHWCSVMALLSVTPVTPHSRRITVLSFPSLVGPTAECCVFARVACASCLRVHHVRLAAIKPPVAQVTVFDHVLGMELGRNIGSQNHRRYAILGPIHVNQLQRVLPQAFYVVTARTWRRSRPRCGRRDGNSSGSWSRDGGRCGVSASGSRWVWRGVGTGVEVGIGVGEGTGVGTTLHDGSPRVFRSSS